MRNNNSNTSDAQRMLRGAATSLCQAADRDCMPEANRAALRAIARAWRADADRLEAYMREATMHLDAQVRSRRGR